MPIFQKFESSQAHLKMGLMGFAGSGKTWTATETTIGLISLLRELKLPDGGKPVFFLDTETGVDYVKPKFDSAKIGLQIARTRAFVDLVPAVREAEKSGSVLIIDSLSHFWREFTEAYAKRMNRTRLQFQDWMYLKTEWGRFTDAYINSAVHIILCGRAGYEYDYFEDEDGKKELHKTGIKMKAETETGYEPSLLLFMERSTNLETKKVSRVAHVLKDRFGLIDGITIANPTFKDFSPHIQALNLGGKQVGIDPRTSESMIHPTGKSNWQREQEAKTIALDEIAEVIRKHFGGQDKASKDARGDLVEKHFGTRSWKRMEALSFAEIEKGRNTVWVELEGAPYHFEVPDEDVPADRLDKNQQAENATLKKLGKLRQDVADLGKPAEEPTTEGKEDGGKPE